MIASKMGHFVFKLGLIKKTQLCLQQQQQKLACQWSLLIYQSCLTKMFGNCECLHRDSKSHIHEEKNSFFFCKMPFKTLWLKNSYKQIS